jgi:hypothetical protein
MPVLKPHQIKYAMLPMFSGIAMTDDDRTRIVAMLRRLMGDATHALIDAVTDELNDRNGLDKNQVNALLSEKANMMIEEIAQGVRDYR